MAELAQAMEKRITRIGEYAAQTRPRWVIRALGDPPQDVAQRAEWTVRAGRLSAYREMYGYCSPGEAIGPEPGRTSPEARADWHTAFAVLCRVAGADLRGCSDSQLRLRRGAYKQEAAWAPPYVAEDLRLARLQAPHRPTRTSSASSTRAGSPPIPERLPGMSSSPPPGETCGRQP